MFRSVFSSGRVLKDLGKFLNNNVHQFNGTCRRIHVRRAELSDYEAVMGILPDIYGGADYLPHQYHGYICDQKSYPYVALVGDTVAGYTNYYMVEDGHARIATAGRTLVEHQKKGLLKEMRSFSLQEMLMQHPELRKEYRVVLNSPYHEQDKRAPSDKGKVIHKQIYLQYLTTKPQLTELLNQLESTPKALNKTQGLYIDSPAALGALPDKLLEAELFPNNCFVTPNYYYPYTATHENLAPVCQSADVVVSVDGSQSCDGDLNVIDTCTAVSFGIYHLPKVGPSLVIMHYGKTTEDLYINLKRHLQLNRKYFEGEGKANLELCFPMELPLEEVKGKLEGFIGSNSRYIETPSEILMVKEVML